MDTADPTMWHNQSQWSPLSRWSRRSWWTRWSPLSPHHDDHDYHDDHDEGNMQVERRDAGQHHGERRLPRQDPHHSWDPDVPQRRLWGGSSDGDGDDDGDDVDGGGDDGDDHQVEDGNGADRHPYLEEHKIKTYLIVPPDQVSTWCWWWEWRCNDNYPYIRMIIWPKMWQDQDLLTRWLLDLGGNNIFNKDSLCQ